jgi:uncharacterized protein YndB with AHSA1/START domain
VPPIVESVEIARPADQVYAYMVDPTHLTEWQEGLVSVRQQGEASIAVGSRFVTVRRVGGRERTMTMEMVELNPPKSFRGRGVDGPVRGIVHGRVESIGDGTRSRATIELDFEAHGIGILLVPLVVRRQAKKELPSNMRMLKDALEQGGTQRS